MDLDAMTDYEIIAGLLRGDRESLKLGYLPQSAVLATMQLRGTDPEEPEHRVTHAVYLAYAIGFAEGLIEDPESAYPAISA